MHRNKVKRNSPEIQLTHHHTTNRYVESPDGKPLLFGQNNPFLGMLDFCPVVGSNRHWKDFVKSVLFSRDIINMQNREAWQLYVFSPLAY